MVDDTREDRRLVHHQGRRNQRNVPSIHQNEVCRSTTVRYGAFHNGGRYNVAGLFGALYLGIDEESCRAEVSQGIAAGVPFKKGAFTAWDYSVDLRSVVRLDEKAVQDELELTESEITIPGNHWTASGIGEHLHKRGDIEALMAPSAHLKGGKCLDVYLDRVALPQHVTPKNKIRTWPEK